MLITTNKCKLLYSLSFVANTHAPRRPVSDVCHRAAAACHAPCSNTTAGRTNKSMEVCVWFVGTKRLWTCTKFYISNVSINAAARTGVYRAGLDEKI